MSVNAIQHELHDIKIALGKLAANKDGLSHLVPLQEKLHQIESKRKDGKFVAHDGSVPAGQAELVSSLEECYELVYKIQNGVKSIEQELRDIKAGLEKLAAKKTVTFDEINPFQDRLRIVESKRIDGKFYDDPLDKSSIPAGQATLISLLEECHEKKQSIMNKIN